MKNINLYRLLGSAVIVFAATRALCQVDVLTQHNDVHRSGANLQEKQLTVASVRQSANDKYSSNSCASGGRNSAAG